MKLARLNVPSGAVPTVKDPNFVFVTIPEEIEANLNPA